MFCFVGLCVVSPQVLQSPITMVTSEHSRVVLVCEFTGSPRPLNLMWVKREGSLPIMSRRVVMTTTSDNSTVQLFNVSFRLSIRQVLDYMSYGKIEYQLSQLIVDLIL